MMVDLQNKKTVSTKKKKKKRKKKKEDRCHKRLDKVKEYVQSLNVFQVS